MVLGVELLLITFVTLSSHSRDRGFILLRTYMEMFQ